MSRKLPPQHSWLKIIPLSVGLMCSLTIIPPQVNAIEFPDAPERNPPKSTAAGGRRGGCISGNQTIKAFTPGDNNYIKTVSGQPQLFVYIPKTKAKFLQFAITNQNGENVNFQEIQITDGNYVMTINLPQTMELQTNQKYQWEVSLICQPMFINTGNYTKGIIERVSLPSEVQAQLETLAQENTVAQAQLYANQNIWSETLSLTYTLRESQPEQWQQLLTSVGLGDYADKIFTLPNTQVVPTKKEEK